MMRRVKSCSFLATIECPCESCTISTSYSSLNGYYTHMLSVAQNLSWRGSCHQSSPAWEFSNGWRLGCIVENGMGLGGHCYHHPELSACQLILSELTKVSRSHGKQKSRFVNVLLKVTKLISANELASCVKERTL